MARERGNPEVARSFQAVGGFAEKKTDLWNALNALRHERGESGVLDVEPGGHPDYTVLVPPYGFFVEVKWAESNFALADLAPRQREWLDTYRDISWLWLFMGTAINARERPRRAWLVPWRTWLVMEGRLAAAGLKGLPYSTPHRREHRAQGLSACELLQRYALEWAGAGIWTIPPAHPFWRAPQRLAGRFKAPARRKLPTS
jgi:hypothetical protein